MTRFRDYRTPEKTAADCHAWYVKNADYWKLKTKVYRKQLKADPKRWAEFLAKARAYKRKKFGWTRRKKRLNDSVQKIECA